MSANSVDSGVWEWYQRPKHHNSEYIFILYRSFV